MPLEQISAQRLSGEEIQISLAKAGVERESVERKKRVVSAKWC